MFSNAQAVHIRRNTAFGLFLRELGRGRQGTPQSAIDFLWHFDDEKTTRWVQIILAGLINDKNMISLFHLGVRNDWINFTNDQIFAVLILEADSVSNVAWFSHDLSAVSRNYRPASINSMSFLSN